MQLLTTGRMINAGAGFADLACYSVLCMLRALLAGHHQTLGVKVRRCIPCSLRWRDRGGGPGDGVRLSAGLGSGVPVGGQHCSLGLPCLYGNR